MLAMKSLLSSGGMTHPRRFHGFISFFLKHGARFRAKQNQYNPTPQPDPPTAVTTIGQTPAAARCSSTQ